MAPFEPELEFFSASVSPLFLHRDVRLADPIIRSRLLVLHLYDWLEFTEWLELGPVNSACEMLRRETFLPWLPAEMRADALKIYTDEAGHAEMSHALGDAVIDATGIQPLRLRPAFISILDAITGSEEPVFEPLLTVLFAAMSETLITGSLKRLPNDPTVQPAVRDLAKDHAIDEGLHHAFFRSVFIHIWPRLPCGLRCKLGPQLAPMILAFLQPDIGAMTRMLEEHADVFEDPIQIANEVAESAEVRAITRQAASPAIRVLAQGGAFRDKETTQAFLASGLRPPSRADSHATTTVGW